MTQNNYERNEDDNNALLNDISGTNETIISQPATEFSVSNKNTKKRKHASEDILSKAYSVLAETEDDYDIFGKFVGSEIRKLTQDHLRNRAKREIQRILLNISEENEENMSRTFTPITRSTSTFSSGSSNSNCTRATVQDGNYSDYNNIVNQEGISNIAVDTDTFLTELTQ